MAISTSWPIHLLGLAFGLIFIGFGCYDIVNPEAGLSFFEFTPSLFPETAAETSSLLVIIGIRDIFMGVAILATLNAGQRNVAGWILITASAVAFTDGIVCFQHGKGAEWNHWGYAPLLTVTGALLLGWADGKAKIDVGKKSR
jgi:hypothetical protein